MFMCAHVRLSISHLQIGALKIPSCWQECDRHMACDETTQSESPSAPHMSIDDNSGTVSSPRAARWDGEDLPMQPPSTPMMIYRMSSAPSVTQKQEEHFMEISLDGMTAFPPFASEGDAEPDQTHRMEVLPTVSEDSVSRMTANDPSEFHTALEDPGSVTLERSASGSSFGASHAEYFVATVTGSTEVEDEDGYFVFAS